jgi:hypothetical protein
MLFRMVQEEKEFDTSTYWFIILPVMIISILFFGFYTLFRVSSVQTTQFSKLESLVKTYNNNKYK